MPHAGLSAGKALAVDGNNFLEKKPIALMSSASALPLLRLSVGDSAPWGRQEKSQSSGFEQHLPFKFFFL